MIYILLLMSSSKYTNLSRIFAASLVQVVTDIGLKVNSDTTEFMRFNQDGVIISLNGKPLKLVGQSTYFGSNISST